MKIWVVIFSTSILLVGVILLSVLLATKRGNQKTWPKTIIMTYHKPIPQKIFESLDVYAKGYKVVVYNDKKAREFILTHFGEKTAKAFDGMKKGAFKADLFRYCVLYIEGGVYLDVKTWLIKPLDEIFTDRSKAYTVLGTDHGCIHQGILVSPPKNPIFPHLIHHIVRTGHPPFQAAFTREFYKHLSKFSLETLHEGNHSAYGQDWILFQEVCHQCEKDEEPDIYGSCCQIVLNSTRLFNTRYPDFGKTW